MRLGKFWLRIAFVHDLSCTWSDLSRAAFQRAGEKGRENLVSAAIHFVIQLAIDTAPGDAQRLRELERQMIEAVEGDLEDVEVPSPSVDPRG